MFRLRPLGAASGAVGWNDLGENSRGANGELDQRQRRRRRSLATPDPRRVRRDDIPDSSRYFFDLAPVLATHDGPWVYSRRPRLGAALKIAGVIVAVMMVVALIVDQVRDDTLMEGQLVVAGFASAFLGWILLAAPGAIVAKGKLRYQPSGRTLAETHVEYPGSVERGAAVYEALTSRGITRQEIQEWAPSRDSAASTSGTMRVAVYWSDRDDAAYAAVHLEYEEDGHLVWPPVEIPRGWVAGLTPRYEEPGPSVSYPHQS